jgi:ADP-ribose pyrophosphatase YjhB (NUDIX family)
MSQKPIVCADAIARYGSGIVVIERLSSLPGLALPGGKQDPGETLSETIVREVWEETGLRFVIEGVLGTYADPKRDPRGRYVSTVFSGIACGTVRDEGGKTRVLILTEQEIRDRKDRFVLDHFRMLEEYLLL